MTPATCSEPFDTSDSLVYPRRKLTRILSRFQPSTGEAPDKANGSRRQFSWISTDLVDGRWQKPQIFGALPKLEDVSIDFGTKREQAGYAMQTISLPYRCPSDRRHLLEECRRMYSAAVRTAYAHARDDAGKSLRQKDLRDLVKARFAGRTVDSWILHCATLEGMELRKRVPDGRMIFGGRKAFEARINGLIDNASLKSKRLRPLVSRGDLSQLGNRHFRLSADARTCVFQMYGHKVVMDLPLMTGNAGEILRQAAALAAARKINLTFRLDDHRLHVTLDPSDLPNHPERRQPIRIAPGRAIGIDLNPAWIGLSAVQNVADPRRLDATDLLDWSLLKLEHDANAPLQQVREVLASACEKAIGLARKWGAGVIVVEQGLGKLRSSATSRKLNQLLNYWGRTVFVRMLRRKAALSGIRVIEVWAGYSTTIGNSAFEAPDACASACEIARRGLARLAGMKDVLPVLTDEVLPGLWKDRVMPNELREAVRRASTWGELHREIKAAKNFGYRRPHPRPDADPGGRQHGGLAVCRMGKKGRPGLQIRPSGLTVERRGQRSSGSKFPRIQATLSSQKVNE